MKYITHARLVAWWNCSHAYRSTPDALGAAWYMLLGLVVGKAALAGRLLNWVGVAVAPRFTARSAAGADDAGVAFKGLLAVH